MKRTRQTIAERRAVREANNKANKARYSGVWMGNKRAQLTTLEATRLTDAGMPTLQVDLIDGSMVGVEELRRGAQKWAKDAKLAKQHETIAMSLDVGQLALTRVAQMVASNDPETRDRGLFLWVEIQKALQAPAAASQSEVFDPAAEAELRKRFTMGYQQPAPGELEQQERQLGEDSDE